MLIPFKHGLTQSQLRGLSRLVDLKKNMYSVMVFLRERHLLRRARSAAKTCFHGVRVEVVRKYTL